MQRKFFALMLVLIMSSISEAQSYDVLVAGGGTGGISAAIQAVRLGVSAAVIESTGMLGGQATAAGVSTMDDMSHTESGIYHEFIDRVRAFYAEKGKSISTCYWKTWSKAFEPYAGHKILAEMSENVDVIYHSKIVSVDLSSRTAEVITPEGPKTISYKILIDATEYGDILPLAGVAYRSGNSISPNIDTDRMIQDITWTAIIRKYPDGVPEKLKPKSPLPEYEKAKKNYEGYVKLNGTNFEGKYPIRLPLNFVSHNGYRAVPDSFLPGNYTGAMRDLKKITKTGVNWGNDYPGQYLWDGRFGIPVTYLEDKALRDKLEREALIKTLHFIYYMQNELGESWSVDENEYGELPEAAKDLPEEWQEVAKHMPPIPYVRESRRMLGNYTLNSKAIHDNCMSYRKGNKNNEFYDTIAIGGYTLDLHGGDDDDDIERDLGERQASIYRDEPPGAFQVPMRALIPRSADNFLAAEKNLSMSRLASGALRLQPITMMTGQAAGALAAISILQDKQPRDVKAIHVQKVLLDSEVLLSLGKYADVPEDNKFYNSIQIANLYKLLEPRRYPVLSEKRVSSPDKAAGKKGRFGINERISPKELSRLVSRAEKVTGKKLTLPAMKKNISRGEAVDIVVKLIESM